ncbi:MAG: biotin/lipoyl-binding protein [Oscillospiraceae bacterium]|nr:biotin/lipoyl-binding protein [Oscillospiraceae bacterium]
MKYIVTLNGKNYEVEVEETEAVIVGVTDAAPAVPAAPAAAPSPAPAAAPSAPAAPASAADGTKVLSPMPGNILAVNVSVGAAVKAGDVLLVLEAMKMENDIVAPCDGTVKQILVQKGSTVATDDLLAVVG